MKKNREIRAASVRLIDSQGEQLGILPFSEALYRAEQQGLDLVEIAANAQPPVCKITDYSKLIYEQKKKDKENKKAQHQVKIKEIKLKPNTDDHDLMTKLRHARDFILEGNKVRVTCMFRGREMMHPEFGENLIKRMCEDLSDIASAESFPKMMGRTLSIVLAPGAVKKKIPSAEPLKNPT